LLHPNVQWLEWVAYLSETAKSLGVDSIVVWGAARSFGTDSLDVWRAVWSSGMDGLVARGVA
jgi:hypothetical protein